nr:hypothetical protein DGKKSRWO_DGKKSRWO_CDS_0079 [uncultured phage]CAI9752250.1 hypothetical protein CVNMHQAP_CVNMHQAP_CDS_0079 [uncultured phage]
MNNRIWTVDEIKHLLQTNDKMVMRSCIKLYERQTEDERKNQDTIESNGIGFNGADAKFLTSIANQLLHNVRLSVKQLDITRKKMLKYSKQLTRIANNEI